MKQVIEELITQNVIFNKKHFERLDLLSQLNEKEVPIPTANSFMKISEIQPNTSDNEILEHLEEESRNSGKISSNAIVDIQVPIMRKHLLSKNLETLQDIKNVEAQFFALKSHVMSFRC